MYKLVKASKKDIPRLIKYKKDIIYMYMSIWRYIVKRIYIE